MSNRNYRSCTDYIRKAPVGGLDSRLAIGALQTPMDGLGLRRRRDPEGGGELLAAALVGQDGIAPAIQTLVGQHQPPVELLGADVDLQRPFVAVGGLLPVADRLPE